ncbi:hypothetical protein [Bacillus licheniformis]|uniref:hypothetical protein n=2 Tax=Bacillus licheniformis TaxID=1402 RepID=UPI0002E416DC|nr:hypothetical protein [Bacillus licheniformis]TWN77154.1 hypothetical protein CHCC20494_1217 [Bacillus licheniformis]WHF43765.1 hypothetical protein QKW34_14100 [Bacillus licheniformis]
MIVIEKVLEVEILKSGLIINFYGHDALDVGLIEINRIKRNGELQTFEFHLCKTKDFHEFKKNIKEKRRTFLIGEENGVRSFELLVDENGYGTFRYPEWGDRTKEFEDYVLSVKNKVKFPLLEKNDLKNAVNHYVNNELKSLPANLADDESLHSLKEVYFREFQSEQNFKKGEYCYLAFKDWLLENTSMVDVDRV